MKRYDELHRSKLGWFVYNDIAVSAVLATLEFFSLLVENQLVASYIFSTTLLDDRTLRICMFMQPPDAYLSSPKLAPRRRNKTKQIKSSQTLPFSFICSSSEWMKSKTD